MAKFNPKEKLLNYQLLLINFLKKKKLRKSEASFYDVWRVLVKAWERDRINEKAKSMAFNFILAIFPGIIFLFTIIPYIPIPELDKTIMSFLSEVMPESLYVYIADTVEDIVSKQRGSLLSFGFLLALFSATNGTLALMESFNSIHHNREKRNLIKSRLTAIGITLVLTFVLFLSVFVIVVGNNILDYLVSLNFLSAVFSVGLKSINYVVVLATFFIAISFIYYAAPTYTKKWIFVTSDSVLATFLIVIITSLFSIYINNFSNYNKVYGSIGTIIVFMLWMYAISLVILIGFELNSSIETAKKIAARARKEVRSEK